MTSDDAIDELMGRSLVHVLDRDGHGIYLRHPHTQEAVLVAHDQDRKKSAVNLRKLRRIMAGIVFEVVAETQRAT